MTTRQHNSVTQKDIDNHPSGINPVGVEVTDQTVDPSGADLPNSGDFLFYTKSGVAYLIDSAATATPIGGGLTNPMTTTGDIIYSSDNSGTPARRGVGGSNTVLHGGTTPVWAQVTEADLTFSDLTQRDVTSSLHGLAPKAPGVSNRFLNGCNTPFYAQVMDADLLMLDITTNNATTSKHGLLPKLGGGTTNFLRADGSWNAPPGGGSLEVKEIDGAPDVSGVTVIQVSNGTLTDNGGGNVTITTGGGGGGGGGTIVYPVQEKTGASASGSSQSVTLSATPTNGNILILCSEAEGSTNISSITETNVSWSKLAESTASTSPHAEIWVGAVSGSASTSVSVSYSGTTFCGIHVSEWTGLTGTLDQHGAYTNVTGAGSGGGYVYPITPTSTSALVIVAGAESTFSGDFGAGTPGPGLIRFAACDNSSNTTDFAFAFGWPGANSIGGHFANAHGGTFSTVSVSLT